MELHILLSDLRVSAVLYHWSYRGQRESVQQESICWWLILSDLKCTRTQDLAWFILTYAAILFSSINHELYLQFAYLSTFAENKCLNDVFDFLELSNFCTAQFILYAFDWIC